MQYYAIPYINTHLTEKHVSEDNVMFTKCVVQKPLSKSMSFFLVEFCSQSKEFVELLIFILKITKNCILQMLQNL